MDPRPTGGAPIQIRASPSTKASRFQAQHVFRIWSKAAFRSGYRSMSTLSTSKPEGDRHGSIHGARRSQNRLVSPPRMISSEGERIKYLPIPTGAIPSYEHRFIHRTRSHEQYVRTRGRPVSHDHNHCIGKASTDRINYEHSLVRGHHCRASRPSRRVPR